MVDLCVLAKNDQVERAVARSTIGIEGLYPYALVVSEWGPRIRAGTAAQRHGDFAGRFGGNAVSTDGSDKRAVADIASEKNLVYALSQLGEARMPPCSRAW